MAGKKEKKTRRKIAAGNRKFGIITGRSSKKVGRARKAGGYFGGSGKW